MVHYAKFMEWDHMRSSCTHIYVLIIAVIDFTLRVLAARRHDPHCAIEERVASTGGSLADVRPASDYDGPHIPLGVMRHSIVGVRHQHLHIS